MNEKININIKATNIELTEAIRNHVINSVTKLEKFASIPGESQALANVEVSKTIASQHSGEIFRAELNFNVRGDFFRAESTTSDLYASVDDVVKEMERLLGRAHGKKSTMFRRGAAKVKNWLRFGK